MFRKLSRSFQIRLLVSFALIILIFIPGAGYFSYLQARNATEKQIQRNAISTAVQISERIRTFLSQYMYNANLIKAFFENHLISVDKQKDMINYFYLLKGDHPEFVNIYYADRHGYFTMVPPQSPEIHKIFNPCSRPWYKGAVAAKGLHWTNVYLFASTQKPGITISIPIFDDKKMVRGVCGIDIDLSTFSRFLKNINKEKKGCAYIIENRHGRVIAHPDFIQLPWNPEHVQLLSTCLGELKSAKKQFGSTTFHGEDFFTAYTDFPDNDWTVGVTLPMTEFLTHIQNIKTATVTLVFIGMLLSALLSYLLTLTITSPLKTLKQGIERVSKGDLDYKVDISNLDIAEVLATSLNDMANSLRKNREKLKRTYTELAEKEKMAALGQMTAVIAHEIKNPLGVILGSAEVVANSFRPMPMREQAAQFIIEEIERLKKTLKAFLAFAKPASPVFVDTDIVQLLEETLASIEPLLNADGIKVQKKISSERVICYTDKDQIRQVFWNILINAGQAMPNGGSLNISAYYQFTGGWAQLPVVLNPSQILQAQAGEMIITFSDNGCGIQSEQIDTIFEPFVSYRNDGVGLGLSIVNQILKLNCAQIHVKSKPDHGTTFTLTFPCSKQKSEK